MAIYDRTNVEQLLAIYFSYEYREGESLKWMIIIVDIAFAS